MNINQTEEDGGTIVRTCTRLLLGIVAAISACAHTTAMSPLDVDACRRLSEKTERREATVALTNGTEFKAQGLLMAPDSTLWLDPHTGQPRTVATARILRVSIDRSTSAVSKGVTAGFSVGALAALATLLAWQEGGLEVVQAGETAAVWGTAGGFVGGFVGAVAGGREAYYLQQTPPAVREAR